MLDAAHTHLLFYYNCGHVPQMRNNMKYPIKCNYFIDVTKPPYNRSRKLNELQNIDWFLEGRSA